MAISQSFQESYPMSIYSKMRTVLCIKLLRKDDKECINAHTFEDNGLAERANGNMAIYK